ncbi:riboflavin biosynthesis pyrimidine reductase [Sphingomonas jinjuensis]|uniref:Riboflavin biosynthesis pyrimidine reductase n=1 Tax=Sphingomonas jinjuensis TaxID=535907 RepID=A0A840FI51_9SPHN|nr:riboflavin biosynthesis pyrimidine reductase [Sphingomonas jinjuensis]
MTDRPTVICLMQSSLDGGLHPSKFTASPDGGPKEWSSLYEALHDELNGDAWLVGRTTMAEMAKGTAHPPATPVTVERPHHFANRDAKPYAIAVDTRGELHFGGDNVGGDHAVVLLGNGVRDEHLAELAGDGVSYIVADAKHLDLADALVTLRRELGIERLMLEGGAQIVGSFLAAGLVDELHVIVAPALDAREDMEGFVVHRSDGLAGKVRLSFAACKPLDHGAVLLSYEVLASSSSPHMAED